MSNKTFKNPTVYKRSGGISLSKSSLYEDGYDYPIFCLKHLHRDYGVDPCVNCSDKKFLKGFVKKLKLLSDLTWTQIHLSDRHGHGAEKININCIKPSIPSSITKEVKDFLSFYFAGDKGRIVGYQNSNIFHITYIDIDLSVYDHS